MHFQQELGVELGLCRGLVFVLGDDRGLLQGVRGDDDEQRGWRVVTLTGCCTWSCMAAPLLAWVVEDLAEQRRREVDRRECAERIR